MTQRTDILSELDQLSPVVAAIPFVQPYQVPAGYFSDLSAWVLSFIEAESQGPAFEEAVLPASISSKNMPYQLPDGYFNQLSNNILSYIQSVEGEPALPAGLTGEMPFALPVNYFDDLSSTILAAIKAEENESSLPDGLTKTMPQELPQGYFDTLGSDIMAKIRQGEELETLSPLLAGMDKTMPYSLPAGYFDTFAANTVAKATEEAQTPVIPMGGRRKTFYRFAAAASLLGVIALAGTLIFKGPVKPVTPPDNNNSTAIVEPKVSSEDLQQAGIDKVSDEEILNYLDQSGAITPDDQVIASTDKNSDNSVDLNEADLKQILSDYSDEDLQQFLDENPDISDMNN
jgi:hypothetical protein